VNKEKKIIQITTSRYEETLNKIQLFKRNIAKRLKINQKTASLSLSSIKYLEENITKTFLEKQNKDCARVGDFKVPDCLNNPKSHLVQKSLSTNLALISHFDSKR